ncbi:Uncharacterised protein [Vibrio cholerae]|nr:Uncharacterised protein [Vibrio cholerae]
MIQLPIGKICPVSSAIGIKTPGGNNPRLGWFQRISASTPIMLCCSST